jgi:acyl carrier protein
LNDRILDQVRSIAAGLFDIPKSQVTPDLTPANVEAWDSVQQLNLMLELDQAFGVRLEPEDMEQMQSIGQIVQLIERKQG